MVEELSLSVLSAGGRDENMAVLFQCGLRRLQWLPL